MGRRAGGRVYRLHIAHSGGSRGPGAFDAAPIAQPLAAFNQQRAAQLSNATQHVFLVVHVLAVIVDPFTHFGWNEILIPLASHYRPEWMALGIVGLYLGIAIGISTLLRKHIGYKWWRRLHVLTLGIFALATIHGLGIGSDTQTWWALGIYLVSIVLVGALLCRRVFSSKGKHKQASARPIAPARSVSAAPQSNRAR